ncbi:MAG: GntR family transcriptional regulator [Proteobacteria bacterium]|nr:GntR family transcriptional regulator [Desulfobulbaceae bacterium]MBU4154026.1 GntR family transcriptional regulator [Pseudomonadota bacterium]
MVEPGMMNRLMVTKMVDIGAFLDGENLGRILLPLRAVPPDCLIGAMLDVFVHYDMEGRFVATTRKPLAFPGEFGYLKVVKLTPLGALLDWGLHHQLLVPTREQKQAMQEGRSYLVRVIHDPNSKRIIASSKVDQYLDQVPPNYGAEQEVDLLIGAHTDLGYKAIVNNSHWGVLYENEVFQPLKKGDRLSGFIKKVRDDQKIDLSLQPPGYAKVDSLTEKILDQLKRHDGFMAVNDKTPPELIYQWFGVSKKNFKKAIGALYKKKIIRLDKDGICLTS